MCELYCIKDVQDHRGFVFERQNVKKLKMSPGSGGAGRHLSSEIGGRSKTQPRCVARLLNQDVTSSDMYVWYLGSPSYLFVMS